MNSVSIGKWTRNWLIFLPAYEINEKEKVVYVIMIGKREGFYERLRRRLG